MLYATAPSCDVIDIDDAAFPSVDYRRVLGGVVTGVAAACAMVTAVAVAATSIIGIALSANPNTHAKTSTGLQTIALIKPYRRLAGVADFPSLARPIIHSAKLASVTSEPELAHATAPIVAPATAAPPVRTPIIVRAANEPLRPLRPLYAVQDEGKRETAVLASSTQLVELNPPAAPIFTPARPKALAPKRTPELAKSVPLPRPHPLPNPPSQAKREITDRPAAQVTSQVATAAPSPPLSTARKHLAPPQARNNNRPAEQVATAAPSLPAPTARKHLAPQQAHNNSILLAGPGRRTAIYDISGHTVYLPNGKRLEAHSGLADKRDDPRYVGVKNRGPTPPNVYELALRKQLFHGVRAIRLNPVDDGKMHGRDGMLAHTYMLGPSGQSYGCVSIKNYPAFLRAFLNGEVNRLVVVARLRGAPPRIADAGRARAYRYAFNIR